MRPLSLSRLLLLALLLIFAQQGALAHMIGHTGASSETHLRQGDEQHGAALSLSHVCTTCVAFAALDAGGTATTPGLPGDMADHAAPLATLPLASGHHPLPPRARGPPPAL